MLRQTVLTCVMLVVLALPCLANETLTVAVFDFAAKDREMVETAALVADLVRAELTMQDGLRLVTRADMEALLEEQKLGLAGVTDEAAPQVGYLLGAQVVIVGRVFRLNGGLFVTAKVIGVETSRVYGEKVKGTPDAVDTLAEELAAKLATLIASGADTLVAKVQLTSDQVAELKKKVGDGDLPRVYVYVREEVVGTPVPDPAAQTELIYILKKIGCSVVKDRNGDLKNWAARYLDEGGRSAPPRSASVDIAIVGEAVAQFAARTGDLVSSRARVELEVLDLKTGNTLAIDRETNVAVDLAEAIASKAALQKTAAKVAFRLIPEAVAAWRKTSEGK